MADDISSTKLPDSVYSNDVFPDTDDLGLNDQNAEEFSSKFFSDNELQDDLFIDALLSLDDDKLSDQQNFEVTSPSILNRDSGFIHVTSSGNYGGASGIYSSRECSSVGSEAQSQSSLQAFLPGIAYSAQKNARNESNQKAALPPRPGKKNVICDIPPISSNYEAEENPSMCGNDDLQSESTFYLKDETSEMNFQEPKLGMAFSSEDEGYEFYRNYATKMGFRVRKGKTERLKDGTIRKRFLYCSKEGFRSENKSGKPRKYQRKETRTGCNAMVQFTRHTDSGKWEITGIDLEHNHVTNVPNHRHVTFLSTNISEENAGIDITSKAVMVEETVVGNSPESFPFDNISKYYLCNEKINILPPEDSQSLVDFLDHLQLEDPSFFYTVQLDAQSRIINFFWRDGWSKIDYEHFGDVLILDTTFRIEKYDIICALLLGVNHHRQHIFFGCAFLLDDSTNSFIWLFRTFLKAMGKRQPRAIFTDEHQSVSDAVELELHETQHHLGMWYISQNAKKHLSEAFKLPDFDDQFNKCISGCTSEEDFFLKWQKLFETFKLRENSWLNALYNMRKKWSSVFSKGIYSAGIGSLQECKNITDVFHNLMSETMTLSKFVQQYLRSAEQWRREELDFCCNESKWPIILKNSGLEKQAADAYTSTIFKLFQEELHKCQSLAVEEIANNGVIFKFKITDEGYEYNFVEFNCLELKVKCSCKKFESTGILCSHALKVLDARNIDCLPSHYILKRWTKSARDGMVADDHKQEIADQSKGQSRSFTSRVMYKALDVISKSVTVEENQKIVENHLDMARKEVENLFKAKMTRHLDGRDAEIHRRNGGLNGNECMEAQKKVPIPPCSSLEEPKGFLDFTSKRKKENQVGLTERKSCDDDSVIHCWPLKEARINGDDRGTWTSSGSQHYVGEDSQKQPCMPTENMQMPLAMQKTRTYIRKLTNIRAKRYLWSSRLSRKSSIASGVKRLNDGSSKK